MMPAGAVLRDPEEHRHFPQRTRLEDYSTDAAP